MFWGFKFWQKIRYLVNSVKFPENKSKPGRWIGIDWKSDDHLTYKILPENPDKSGNIILTRSVIEPDDGTNLRCNSDRENGWDTHKKINSKSVQGTRMNPRLNPDEDNDLEEDSENEDLNISQSNTSQVKVPAKPSRKSPRLNSPDLISRRNIIDDPKLR